MTHYISPERLTIEHVGTILREKATLVLSEESKRRIERCRKYLDDKISTCREPVYGINTGFGPMAQWRGGDSHLEELQYNIIRSHATGAGEPLSDVEVRSAMLARIGTFMQARSGVSPEVILLLQEFVNREIYPFIPAHGSVGASGDLVQLAHLALCLIGEGKVRYNGEWRPTAEVFSELGLKPMRICVRIMPRICLNML